MDNGRLRVTSVPLSRHQQNPKLDTWLYIVMY